MGESEIVSAIVIFAIAISVSITIFMVTMSSLQYSSLSAEYGYMKSNLVSLANSIPDLLDGGTFSLSVPSQYVGIGYLKLTDKRIQLIVANNTVIDEYPVAIYIRPGSPTATTNNTVFGRDDYIVNNPLFVAKVDEVYVNGETRVILDTARIFVTQYKITTSNFIKYIYYITYVRLQPTVYSSAVSRVLVVGIDSKVEKVITVDQTYISTNNPIIEYKVNGNTIYKVTGNDVPNANSVDVVLRIVTFKVVYS